MFFPPPVDAVGWGLSLEYILTFLILCFRSGRTALYYMAGPLWRWSRCRGRTPEGLQETGIAPCCVVFESKARPSLGFGWAVQYMILQYFIAELCPDSLWKECQLQI